MIFSVFSVHYPSNNQDSLPTCPHLIYHIAGKFGGELNLAVYLCNHQIKIRQYLSFVYTCIYMYMYMWQSLTKLLCQYFAMAILGPTTKFNSCQYFQLCCRLHVSTSKSYIITSFLSNYRSRSTFPLAVKWSSTSGGCAQTRRCGTSGA